MDNKELTNEMFRRAFAFLRTTRKGTLKEIADACGCSEKHIGNILNQDKGVGSSPEIKEKVAGFYSTTLEVMLFMGKDIIEGRLPPITATANISAPLASISGTATGSVQVVGSRASGSSAISIHNGSRTEDQQHQVVLSPKEHEALCLYRKYGNERLLDKCITQLRKIEELMDWGG
jgi:transcriptional regulator with XRE-family HTH domain